MRLFVISDLIVTHTEALILKFFGCFAFFFFFLKFNFEYFFLFFFSLDNNAVMR